MNVGLMDPLAKRAERDQKALQAPMGLLAKEKPVQKAPQGPQGLRDPLDLKAKTQVSDHPDPVEPWALLGKLDFMEILALKAVLEALEAQAQMPNTALVLVAAVVSSEKLNQTTMIYYTYDFLLHFMYGLGSINIMHGYLGKVRIGR